jgi:hypothetical protein
VVKMKRSQLQGVVATHQPPPKSPPGSSSPGHNPLSRKQSRDDGTGSRPSPSLDRPAVAQRSSSSSRLGPAASSPSKRPTAPSQGGFGRGNSPAKASSSFRERRTESQERESSRGKERPAEAPRTTTSGSTI